MDVIRFDKSNNSKIAYYPKIEFSSYSKKLRDDLKKLLSFIGVESYIWNLKTMHKYKLCITGRDKTLFWINNIFSSNPKHQKKFIFYYKNDFSPKVLNNFLNR